ncbi:DUF3859 domain-containing protein [Ancylomarina salipaludis]|uniref:DUF3859 domain-containing protein n=1 Tax=Ancylomarina salipaludis TaxID=2501299 RepID=A0A4Q1JMP6_9BACT|nr:DUF3859 domain-containing protein [Ancylomarina salipaludis]
MGWCFETEDEIVPGQYHMAAHDTDENLIVEKRFVVE